MARRGENIYRRKDGRWEGRYIRERINGRAKYGYVYGKTYSEVREKLFLLRSRCNQKEETQIDEKPFSYFSLSWLAEIKMSVKPSTFVKYKNTVGNHLNPAIGDVKISLLNTEAVRKLTENMLREGNLKNSQPLAPKTVRDLLSVLKQIMDYAEKLGAVINCRFEKISVRSGRERPKPLSQTEQMKLTEYLLHNVNPVNLGILLALYTGIRLGELCALKYGDISLTDKVMRVNKTMQRLQSFSGEKGAKTSIVITSPKSETSVREVPLPDFLAELIGKSRCSEKSFLLTGDEKRYVEPRCMENKFKKCLKLCGIEEVTFHQLRHRFATYAVEIGFEIKSLSEILGHSDVKITLNRYVHSSMELKKSNMEKIQSRLMHSPSFFQS